MRDAQSAVAAGATQVKVGERCVVTPSARDFLRQHDVELVMNGAAAAVAVTRQNGAGAAAQPAMQQARGAANPRLFTTPEAEAIKQEICAVGRKLWNRQYVDG